MQASRSSLARFNEQMAPLYSMIQSLDGIRLAQHLLEPPLKISENVAPEGFNAFAFSLTFASALKCLTPETSFLYMFMRLRKMDERHIFKS